MGALGTLRPAVVSLYSEPAYYRMLFDGRSQDLPFYLDLARAVPEGSPIVELGVGAGRVAEALARAGHRVIGVDRDRAMLDELERRRRGWPKEAAARLTIVHADARAPGIGSRSPLVIMPFNGMAHLHGADELAALFRSVHDLLLPGAHFAFDVMLPDPQLLLGGASAVPWLRHPRTDRVCRAEETYTYEPLSQLLTITTTLVERETEAPPQVLTLCLRQFFPEETCLMLAHHGFEIRRREASLGDSLAYVCASRQPPQEAAAPL